MREDVLRRYSSAEASIGDVTEALRGSVTHLDSLRSTVKVEDMRGSFPVSRQHVVRVCFGRGGTEFGWVSSHSFAVWFELSRVSN
jgi:hypothetical protein